MTIVDFEGANGEGLPRFVSGVMAYGPYGVGPYGYGVGPYPLEKLGLLPQHDMF